MALIVRPAVPADAERLAHIHVTNWRETYAGLMPEAFLDAMTGEARQVRREQEWIYTVLEGRDVVQVAQLNGAVVAFASAGAVRPHTVIPGDYDAELYTLYALRAAQRHGLGRALLNGVAAELKCRGFSGLALWVLAVNPAREFYAHLGAWELGRKTEAIPGGELTEAAMGWRNLELLL